MKLNQTWQQKKRVDLTLTTTKEESSESASSSNIGVSQDGVQTQRFLSRMPKNNGSKLRHLAKPVPTKHLLRERKKKKRKSSSFIQENRRFAKENKLAPKLAASKHGNGSFFNLALDSSLFMLDTDVDQTPGVTGQNSQFKDDAQPNKLGLSAADVTNSPAKPLPANRGVSGNCHGRVLKESNISFNSPQHASTPEIGSLVTPLQEREKDNKMLNLFSDESLHEQNRIMLCSNSPSRLQLDFWPEGGTSKLSANPSTKSTAAEFPHPTLIRTEVTEKANKLLLSSWDLPKAVLSKYHQTGITLLFPWQAECLCLDSVLTGRNLIYSAPTSAGKTMVAELLILKRVLEMKKRAIMILPYVSVALEKVRYLKWLYEDVGIRVGGFLGNQSPSGGFSSVDVAVCTIEKGNSLVNRLMEARKIEELGVVVVDELHVVADPQRGYLLELLITKIRFAVLSARTGKTDRSNAAHSQNPVQIIGMSATLPNLETLAQWLDAALYQTNFRPVPLTECVKVGHSIFDSSMNKLRDMDLSTGTVSGDEDHIVPLSMETVREGFSVLIFCPTKSWCEKLAETVAREFYLLMKNSKSSDKGFLKAASILTPLPIDREALSDIMEQLWRTAVGLDPVLQKTVPWGVAFHHAGLTFDEREILEGGFRRGTLKVLIATSTLSSGVNLPARRVIIRTPVFHGKIIDTLTYKQMIGRAGRKGVDTAGESILVCKPTEKAKAAVLMESSLAHVKSCLVKNEDEELSSCLKRAILEIVVSGAAASPSDVTMYMSCTLLASSMMYKDAEVISRCLQFLQESEFVTLRQVSTEDGQTVKHLFPTQLGSAVLASALSPDEGLHVFAELQRARRCFVLENELHVVYLVTPVYNQNIGNNFDWYNYYCIWEKLPPDMRRVAELVGVEEGFIARAIRGRVPNRTTKQAKALNIHHRFYTALVLHDLVQELPLTSVARKFGSNKGQLQALQQSAATFAGMVTAFCSKLGWTSLELLLSQFQSRLTFGVQRELCNLVRVPLLSGQQARTLYQAGYQSVASLAGADPTELENVLKTGAPFESGKQQDNETSWEAEQRRRKASCIWLKGRGGVTTHEAAMAIIAESKYVVQNDLGFLEMQWPRQRSEESTTKPSPQNTWRKSPRIKRSVPGSKLNRSHGSRSRLTVLSGISPTGTNRERKLDLQIPDHTSILNPPDLAEIVGKKTKDQETRKTDMVDGQKSKKSKTEMGIQEYQSESKNDQLSSQLAGPRHNNINPFTSVIHLHTDCTETLGEARKDCASKSSLSTDIQQNVKKGNKILDRDVSVMRKLSEHAVVNKENKRKFEKTLVQEKDEFSDALIVNANWSSVERSGDTDNASVSEAKREAFKEQDAMDALEGYPCKAGTEQKGHAHEQQRYPDAARSSAERNCPMHNSSCVTGFGDSFVLDAQTALIMGGNGTKTDVSKAGTFQTGINMDLPEVSHDLHHLPTEENTSVILFSDVDALLADSMAHSSGDGNKHIDADMAQNFSSKDQEIQTLMIHGCKLDTFVEKRNCQIVPLQVPALSSIQDSFSTSFLYSSISELLPASNYEIIGDVDQTRSELGCSERDLYNSYENFHIPFQSGQEHCFFANISLEPKQIDDDRNQPVHKHTGYEMINRVSPRYLEQVGREEKESSQPQNSNQECFSDTLTISMIECALNDNTAISLHRNPGNDLQVENHDNIPKSKKVPQDHESKQIRVTSESNPDKSISNQHKWKKKDCSVMPCMKQRESAPMGESGFNISSDNSCLPPTPEILSVSRPKMSATKEIIGRYPIIKTKRKMQISQEDTVTERTPCTSLRDREQTNCLSIKPLSTPSQPCSQGEFSIIDVCADHKLFSMFISEWKMKTEYAISVGCERIQTAEEYKIGTNFIQAMLPPKEDSTVSLCLDDAAVVGLSVCWGDHDAYFVSFAAVDPLADPNNSLAAPPLDDQLTVQERLNALRSVLEHGSHCSQEVSVIAYDIKSQYKAIARACGILVKGKFEDPKIASWILDPGSGEGNLHQLVMNCLPSEHYLLEDVGGGVGSSSLGLKGHNPGSGRHQATIQSVLTWHLMMHFRQRLVQENLDNAFTTVEMPVTVTISRMELNGFGFSQQESERQKTMMQAKLSALEEQAYQLAGHPFSLTSPDSVAQILYFELRLPAGGDLNNITTVKKTLGPSRRLPSNTTRGRGSSKSNFSTAKEVLEKLRQLHALPAVILEWRRISSALTKVVFPLQKEKQHCPKLDMHHVFGECQLHTATGRVSMSDPNLQNIPKDFQINLPDMIGESPPAVLHNVCLTSKVNRSSKRHQTKVTTVSPQQATWTKKNQSGSRVFAVSMRHAFVPFRGGVILTADYSQLELRIIAHLSSDQKLINILNADGDIFKLIAAQWKSILPGEVTNEQRQQAKQICYGMIYGIGARSLGEQLGIDENEASIFMETFKAKYPAMQVYLHKTVELCQTKGYAQTILGRKRYLPSIKDPNPFIRLQAERQAVNTTVQGSAADLVKTAMLNVERELIKAFPECARPHRLNDTIRDFTQIGRQSKRQKKLQYSGAYLILQLHDELIYEVVQKDLETAVKIIQNEMQNAMKLCVRVPVKVKVGPSWGMVQELGL